MVDPFLGPMNLGAPLNSDGSGYGYMQPPVIDDRYLGPPPSTGYGTTSGTVTNGTATLGANGGPGLIGPPESVGGNPNRFQGRLRQGRGLPPGQLRQQQRMEQAGGFQPGWRQLLRQRGGMGSMNGGGFQGQGNGQPSWRDIFLARRGGFQGGPPQWQPQMEEMPFDIGVPQYQTIVPDQGFQFYQGQNVRPQFDPFVGPF